MNLLKNVRQLCTPAYVYFVISIIAFLILAAQNLTNSNQYCIGTFKCPVPHTGMVFAVKLVYIAFWTWLLNVLCKAGYKQISWFLVLLPFVLFFVLIGLMLLNQVV